MDPLSNFAYSYTNYDQLANNGYGYNVKEEHCNQNVNNIHNSIPQQYMGTYPLPYLPNVKPVNEETNTNVNTTENQINQLNYLEPTENQPQNEIEEEIDTKEGIPLLPEHRKKAPKKKGKTSNYWNKKIEDKNFPFYGCTICNVSFQTIQLLDEHVTIHKGRITSYDIRVRNKIKRKEKIKQMKKNKKLGKAGKKQKKDSMKKEKDKLIEIDIKPEDGYIGNEKASEFNESQNTDTQTKEATYQNSELSKCQNPVPKLEGTTNQNSESNKPQNSVSEPKESTNQTSETNAKSLNECEDKANSKSNEKCTKILEPEDPRLMKLFKCFACQKQFSLSYYLRLHVRSHTDEKPYTCAQCGQSFITASKLGRHNKRIHLAVRFQCRICYRFFSRFDILTRHFDKTHSAEKIEGEPYDFNAILPYLKELEEQLREQTDDKPKTEGGWADDALDVKCDTTEKDTTQKVISDNKVELDSSEVPDEKVKLDLAFDMDTKDNIVDENLITMSSSTGEHAYVKEDKEEVNFEEVKVELELEDDHGVNSPRSGDFSDEDYFPVNTWAAPPSPIAPAPPLVPAKETGTPKGRGRPKKTDFPVQCELCDKTIKTATYYKVHLRTHSGEKPFKCFICGRGFITSSKLHRHVVTHHEWQGDEEEATKVKEEDKPEIKEEADQDETGPKVKKKKRTRKGTKTVKVTKTVQVKTEKVVEGRKRNCRKRPHACIYCNKRFLHLETLRVHKKSHEGQEIVLKCNFCLEVCADEEALKTHEAAHSGPRPYVCTVCNRCYTKKETMIYHRKTHDSSGKGEKREYICDICSKTFNAQCKLHRHLVSHKVEKFVLRYECPVCAHMFHTKYHIKMHLTTHQKEGLIIEENRNEILAMVLQNARKIPRKPEHTATVEQFVPRDERSRVCNICGQVFQHFYYLEEHLKSHGSRIAIEDENKPEDNKHICPVCNKGFKLHYYLKLHSFTHSKERPFICQQCGKGFITKGKLKRHLETHTGLKKYQCHICCKYFTRPSYLRIHVRTIHGTQDYNFRLNNQYGNEHGA